MRAATYLLLGSLFLPSNAFAQKHLWTHRPVPEDVKANILKERGESGKVIVQQLELMGLRGTLTPEQWREFRRRGVPEMMIVDVLDAHGLTPEISSALASIGVDLETEENWKRKGPGHYAALADLVLVGRIQKIEYHIEGPYHTWVRVVPQKILKGKGNEPEIVVKLLVSGPVLHPNGQILIADSTGEPSFAVGERVLLFLQSRPEDLLHLHRVERALDDPTNAANFGRNHGTIETIEAELARGGYFELLWGAAGAYKIVGNRAVSKHQGDRIPNPNEEKFDLGTALELVQRVADVQSRFVRGGIQP